MRRWKRNAVEPCVLHNDFIMRVRNKDAELDVKMDPILSRTIMNVLCCTTSHLFKNTLQFCRRGVIFSTTWLTQIFFTKPSTWNCSDGRQRCLRLCPLIAARAPKVFGLITRHLTAQILPRMSRASRASRPGLAVGILCVLCNGVCMAQQVHMKGVKNKDVELDAKMNLTLLSHYNECRLLYNFFTAVWRNAAILRRRGHLPHDLITQIFLRSLQDEIVVMGFIDACLRSQPPPPECA